ncbi:MAG: glycoside hydrolase family 38 C-terminal domain-containing protein [Gemmatimonadaceae bacterium]
MSAPREPDPVLTGQAEAAAGDRAATPADSPPLDVLVVSHTHWDREWYHPSGRFRQRLVALVDELLDDAAAGRGAGSPFLLDGQGVVLDDYLAVRPERRDALERALRDGVLEAGPWYVLADELLPSAEALVRNLLAGRRALHALGAAPPPVLYCPDSFGHPAALPSLAAGFGLDVVIAWRGYGGRRWPPGDAVRWRAPDGATALLWHLPRDGYELGSSLPTSPTDAAERWARMRAELAPRAQLGVLLVQNGADHHARQLALDEAAAALAAAAAPDRVVRASLAAFAAEAVRRAAARELPVVAGELRDSYGYTWTLQGTFATRAAQKRRNALAERLLARESEPWALLASRVSRAARAGGEREAPRVPFAPLLRAAWTTLLLCHPHDTLCGCSTDEVARAMDARLDDALAQGAGVRDDALEVVVGHDPVAARTRRDAWRRALVVRNPAPRPRGGVAEVELLTFLRDVPVGPGSGGRATRTTHGRGAPVDAASSDLPIQLLGRSLRHDRIESPRHYPDDDLVEAARAVVWVPPMAGYGTRSYELVERVAPAPAPPPGVAPVTARDLTLSNGLLTLSVGADGEISLDAPALPGASITPLLRFEDVGDGGDLYTPSPVGRPVAGAWFRGARVLHGGPLRGELEARWRLRVPSSLAVAGEGDGDEPPVRPRRSRRHVELDLAVRLILDAGAPFVRVHVEGENLARDHRLRVRFATGVTGGAVRADAAFGPVARFALAVPPEDRVAETPPPTAPLHRFVTVHDAMRGVTLFSDGLAEYEAGEDGGVAVTLVRAVSELSRDDLPERPGHAGWPVPTPEAQSLGPFAARFALMPHAALDDAVADAIERAADDVLVPLAAATLRSALALPAPTRGFELTGAGLAFSAAKPSEDGQWAVLRCVNVTERPVAGRWSLGFPIGEARLARLDETPVDVLPVEGDGVPFVAGPRGVVTVLVR